MGWVEVTVSGITLRVSMPESAVEAVGSIGNHVRIFTALHVRDDSITLFGFPTKETRSTFEALTTVNGVGPRLALGILSALTPEALAIAVTAGDPDAFKTAPGVGTKTANRILLELKGKLDWDVSASPEINLSVDLVSALTALGYTVAEVKVAISSLPRDQSMTLENQIRHIVSRIGER